MRLLLVGLPLGALLLGACTRDTSHRPDSTAVAAASVPDSVSLQRLDTEWKRFVAALPADSSAAASALESFRTTRGLPMEFAAAASTPLGWTKAMNVTDADLAGKVALMFVTRMPRDTASIHASPVWELDSAGTVVRRWYIPMDVDFWPVVEGVSGDELITAFRAVRANVHLRFRPDGTYRVSADAPPGPPGPPGVKCPGTAEFEGMMCSSFPGTRGPRVLAYPIPMT